MKLYKYILSSAAKKQWKKSRKKELCTDSIKLKSILSYFANKHRHKLYFNCDTKLKTKHNQRFDLSITLTTNDSSNYKHSWKKENTPRGYKDRSGQNLQQFDYWITRKHYLELWQDWHDCLDKQICCTTRRGIFTII